ncbi:copper amine oxidase N-terminal domain-containing protein [Cohnella sp.]|uniref:copper amine oxidase N-terminal domain-containing protein n=1 Tax=Cohnella sp. TaxID=1883426 RepID=UPI003703EEC1
MLLAILLFVTAVPVSSAASASKAIYVNGTKVQYAQEPISENGTTLVSARETIEALGLKFQWDKSSKRVIGTSDSGETTIAIVIGEYTATINGMYLILGTPAVEKNGRVMLPLRFLTDSLGASLTTKGNTTLIKTVAEDKCPYYTGLPLEITNTYVKNRSKQTLTVNYEEYASNGTNDFIYSHSVTLGPGKKGAFNLYRIIPGNAVPGEDDTYYLGRAVKSISIGADDTEIVTESNSYNKAYKYISSGDFGSALTAVYRKILEENTAQFKQELKQELIKNKYVPLKVIDSYITYSVLDTPEANIQVANLTEKTIVSFDVTFKCYDNYGDPVVNPTSGSSLFKGTTRTFELSFGDYTTFTWDLLWQDNTSSLRNITITKVAYSDGTVWKRK